MSEAKWAIHYLSISEMNQVRVCYMPWRNFTEFPSMLRQPIYFLDHGSKLVIFIDEVSHGVLEVP